MKIVYESKVNQKQYINILHCSPLFFGEVQLDYIMVHATAESFFAQLLLVFTVSAADVLYPVCLVQPLDAPLGPPNVKDCELGTHCVSTHQNVTEFIFT